MQKSEIALKHYDDWKARYSKLYTTRLSSRDIEDPARRVSFLGAKSTAYRSLLMKERLQNDSQINNKEYHFTALAPFTTILPEQSDTYQSYLDMFNKPDSSRAKTDTLLLDIVRAKNREIEDENQDKTLELPRDDVSEAHSSDVCMHGFTMRMTDRSISRRSISRVSRISQRRDMDIPSILAFTATVTPAPAPLENPAFQKVVSTEQTIPRWSVRRATCPVCSQKWKDRSSIDIIKHSGLKRSTPSDIPSVIAPARLRSAITMEYTPRPNLTLVEENKNIGIMRNSSASWQLKRARRFRTPKLQMPPPEAMAPLSSTAPMAQKDLDIRVKRFLTDEGVSKYILKPSFN